MFTVPYYRFFSSSFALTSKTPHITSTVSQSTNTQMTTSRRQNNRMLNNVSHLAMVERARQKCRIVSRTYIQFRTSWHNLVWVSQRKCTEWSINKLSSLNLWIQQMLRVYIYIFAQDITRWVDYSIFHHHPLFTQSVRSIYLWLFCMHLWEVFEIFVSAPHAS